jgi:WXXGXW repeat (2 copies)
MRKLTAALLVTASLFASTACVSASGRVYVRVGPPPPRVEAVLVAPGPRYVWLPGFYRWDGGGYVWMPGRYELPPRARAAWVPPHWERHRRGWYVVEGHWR